MCYYKVVCFLKAESLRGVVVESPVSDRTRVDGLRLLLLLVQVFPVSLGLTKILCMLPNVFRMISLADDSRRCGDISSSTTTFRPKSGDWLGLESTPLSLSGKRLEVADDERTS